MVKTEYYKDLTKMNTFGMKVKARCFVEYDSVADLVDIEFEELARPVLHIGGGSNLLFTDDFKGTILHSKINFIEILEESSDCPSPVLVPVGAGVVFDDFCAWAAKEGLWGVENLSYIPSLPSGVGSATSRIISCSMHAFRRTIIASSSCGTVITVLVSDLLLMIPAFARAISARVFPR